MYFDTLSEKVGGDLFQNITRLDILQGQALFRGVEQLLIREKKKKKEKQEKRKYRKKETKKKKKKRKKYTYIQS